MANEEAGSTSIETTPIDNTPLFAALQKTDRFTVRAAASKIIYRLTDVDLDGLLRVYRNP